MPGADCVAVCCFADEAGRIFDDGYRLGRDRVFALVGGGRRLVVTFERGYPYAQMHAPGDHDFVAIDPMTAPTDALRRGAAPVLAPGGHHSSRLRVSLT